MAASDVEIRAAEDELRRGFQTLEVVQKDPAVPVYHIYLNRAAQRNALTVPFFSELPRALSLLSVLPSARALVLAARGPHFCSGIDLEALRSLTPSPSPSPSPSPAAAADLLRGRILSLQAAISSLERFRKPVVAAIQGACVGGGVDLAAACDIRYCSDDAFFVVKEVDLALAADLGSLQRLPHIIGYGNAVDLALTCRRVSASEAKAIGLVSRVFPSPSALEEGVDQLAKGLAEKSSVAVMGTKAVLLKSRDQKVDEGLDYVATWNSAMLMSPDLEEAVAAHIQKRKPNFSKL
ncbi:delta(3,5)-Delta(2,4)-dienoyl-CoA isomerase, peroxisomal [Dendrobium catenatum]|uniref:1,4-Dihydroxy-2-naphthoyl-CoA synthase, peroxisomal n=1 Tax=Dendrobium catenatum TaxID=906689 RepID=A0A2I0WKH6_9ASPA|nr:delta(3,5)-Delta(2,4)-dienoyl-CoA isomerase, peroxisomal [Dendrobium catenatum]PKU76164.1 1,4-Dihydroxy-2-naphthoyl-CoA synthase, peroxisomal [Dendrobium catenatum]